MTFVPAYFEVPADGAARPRCAFVLHGIFGSGRNWRTFAGELARVLPAWRFVLVDLRNHGDSQGAPPPHTLDACGGDLEALAQQLGIEPDAVVGHSFGGKVALAYAQRARRLRTLLLLDSPPGPGTRAEREPRNTEAGRVLHALRTLPMPVKSRAEVASSIEALGVQSAVAAWMATNLRPRPDGLYAWHFDVDALGAMLEDYWDYDGWPQLETPREGLAIHCVRAANSDRFDAADVSRLEALAARGAIGHHVLPDAGHWLHVDNPIALRDLVMRLLTDR